MKNFKLILVLLTLTGLTLASCSKEEAATPAADKKTLLSKTWKIQEFYEDGQLIQDPELSSVRLTFNSAGTYSVIAGGNSDNGTWAFNSAEDRIIMDGGTVFEQTWTLRELTSSKLRVTYTEDGTAYEIIYNPA